MTPLRVGDVLGSDAEPHMEGFCGGYFGRDSQLLPRPTHRVSLGAIVNDPQNYRLEVRWDFTGTQDEAIVEAHRVASLIGGEVTAVLDEEWDELET